MAQIHLEISDYDKNVFKSMVGERNMSTILKNYIKNYISQGGDTSKKEYVLRKELNILENEKKKIDTKYLKIKSQVDIIEDERKQSEINKLERMKKENIKKNKIIGKTLKSQLSEMV